MRARNRWISASQSYKRSLDSFKNLLGLPPDAHIELDRAELEQLAASLNEMPAPGAQDKNENDLKKEKISYIDALISLMQPDKKNAYRKSFISLERAIHDVQILEDDIKLDIRNTLGDLLESRESLQIQSMSVSVAQKRVNSINLFLEAGRAEIRYLLETQEALLSAPNGLTSAIINYRIAELELQRDMGLL